MRTGKKIAVFSMTPLFPDFAMGGGQKQLKKVALYLGEQGHQLTILSTRREGSMTPFKWHDNVEIHPVLRFKQPYPEPYFTPVYHIANAIRDMGNAIAAADVHYSHDGGLIFPYVYQNTPTVISLRSILYPETLQAAFLFQGDEWILPSEHTRASYEAVVSPFSPKAGECIGSCVETFGNTPFESLGCGTLPILARVAAYRDLLPDEYVHHVDYGDVDAAAAQAHAILVARRRASQAALRYLKAEFSLEAMVTRYADVILRAVKRPQLSYTIPKLTAQTRYRLAPWCYLSEERGIYHDFRASYHMDSRLIDMMTAAPDGFRGGAVEPACLRDWLDNGFVVPLVSAENG